MASAKMIAASFSLMMAFFGAAMAKEYDVVWAAETNYVAWASNITFFPGDKLDFVFDYNADSIDVEQATEETFTQCSHDPIQNTVLGDEIFVLEHSGSYYFVNGYPSRCENGWKLQVNVLSESDAAATQPPPPPSPATPSAPFFPVTPAAPFFPQTPPSPFLRPHRSGGAPSSSLSLSTLTLFFILSLFLY